MIAEQVKDAWVIDLRDKGYGVVLHNDWCPTLRASRVELYWLIECEEVLNGRKGQAI